MLYFTMILHNIKSINIHCDSHHAVNDLRKWWNTSPPVEWAVYCYVLCCVLCLGVWVPHVS